MLYVLLKRRPLCTRAFQTVSVRPSFGEMEWNFPSSGRRCTVCHRLAAQCGLPDKVGFVSRANKVKAMLYATVDSTE